MDPKFAAMFLLFAVAFVAFPTLVIRYRRLELRHQERMAAFEKGIPVPQETVGTPPTIETYQLRGLIWLAVGVGLTLMLFIVLPIIATPNLGESRYRAQNLRELGYSNDEIRSVLVSEEALQRQHSQALAALGIVPIAVGTAYLVFYYQQRKRYPIAAPSRPVKME